MLPTLTAVRPMGDRLDLAAVRIGPNPPCRGVDDRGPSSGRSGRASGPPKEAKNRPSCIDFLAAVLAEQRSYGRMVTLDDMAPAGVAWFGGLLRRGHDVREEAVASTRSSSALFLPAVGYSRSDVSTLASDESDGG